MPTILKKLIREYLLPQCISTHQPVHEAVTQQRGLISPNMRYYIASVHNHTRLMICALNKYPNPRREYITRYCHHEMDVIRECSWSPDSTQFAFVACTQDRDPMQVIKIYDMPEETITIASKGPYYSIQNVVWSLDGRYRGVIDRVQRIPYHLGTCLLFTIQDLHCQNDIPDQLLDTDPLDVVFSTTKGHVNGFRSAKMDSAIRVRNHWQHSTQDVIPVRSNVTDVYSLSPDHSFLVTKNVLSPQPSPLRIYSAATGALMHEITDHTGASPSIQWSNDSQRLCVIDSQKKELIILTLETPAAAYDQLLRELSATSSSSSSSSSSS